MNWTFGPPLLQVPGLFSCAGLGFGSSCVETCKVCGMPRCQSILFSLSSQRPERKLNRCVYVKGQDKQGRLSGLHSMGFFHGKTSKQTSRVKKLLKLALSRLAIAQRPRLARKSISRSHAVMSASSSSSATFTVPSVVVPHSLLSMLHGIWCAGSVARISRKRQPGSARWCGNVLEWLLARNELLTKHRLDVN
jgi:hypothetical protein